mmetsp:Transcript_46082/g.117702  ORF Transcript_46082/g.117702 Transcript_46082/m.117702 type:complete len:292 (+) Transcript_46082:500-1375(+)
MVLRAAFVDKVAARAARLVDAPHGVPFWQVPARVLHERIRQRPEVPRLQGGGRAQHDVIAHHRRLPVAAFRPGAAVILQWDTRNPGLAPVQLAGFRQNLGRLQQLVGPILAGGQDCVHTQRVPVCIDVQRHQVRREEQRVQHLVDRGLDGAAIGRRCGGLGAEVDVGRHWAIGDWVQLAKRCPAKLARATAMRVGRHIYNHVGIRHACLPGLRAALQTVVAQLVLAEVVPVVLRLRPTEPRRLCRVFHGSAQYTAVGIAVAAALRLGVDRTAEGGEEEVAGDGRLDADPTL